MISATVAGNVGRAELKQVGGDSVLQFSVASTSKAKGEKVTTWVTCSLWGKRAEALADYIEKGASVAASGSITMREYEGENGAGVSLEMRVSEVALLGGRRAGERSDAVPPQRQQQSMGRNYDDDIPF